MGWYRCSDDAASLDRSLTAEIRTVKAPASEDKPHKTKVIILTGSNRVAFRLCGASQCEFGAISAQPARPRGDMVFIFWTGGANEDAAVTAGLLRDKHNTDVQLTEMCLFLYNLPFFPSLANGNKPQCVCLYINI